MAMKVEILSRKLIKPSIPTPPNLRHYKIGLIDEFAPMMTIPLVLFFSAHSDSNQKFVTQLEESLEKTLTLMYPLAGRYMKDIRTVDCNDQGAEFIQARLNITLQEILHPEMNLKLVSEFIPSKIWAADEVADAILAAQVTTFQCGGVALGVSVAHRIADASTLSTFLNQWAALSRRDTDVEFVDLSFNSSSSFPARGLRCMETGLTKSVNYDLYVTKKLSFSESAISKMKAKVMLNAKVGNHVLSKVQLVSALIWKALISVDCAIHGYKRDSILIQPVNIREKTKSLLPKNSCGNLWGHTMTTCRAAETSTEFEELADMLTYSVKKTIKDYSKVRHDSDEGQMMVLDSFYKSTNVSNNAHVMVISSWCKFPYYEADFGFGKPISASLGSSPFSNATILLDDAAGNGVEAYVYLGVEEVPYFEQDEALKAFVA